MNKTLRNTYHWQQVESERSLERYVQIYELLNGGTPDGGS
jgi:hypothetical protein